MNPTLERKAFEKNYQSLGGDLRYLKWEEYLDGSGEYQPDWSKIEGSNKGIIFHAQHVTGCLLSWLECAKAKAIPNDFVLMPKEPTQEMIDQEMQGKVLPAVVGSHERAVESFKKRYRALLATQEVTQRSKI